MRLPDNNTGVTEGLCTRLHVPHVGLRPDKINSFSDSFGPVAARYIVATACLTGSYACGGFTDFLKTLHACLTAFCMKHGYMMNFPLPVTVAWSLLE